MKIKNISKLAPAIFIPLLLLHGWGKAFGGEFSINPMILELGSGEKTGIISIRSGEKEKKIHFQVSAYDWAQGAKGEDIYTPTKDLVVFPKMLDVEPGEQRIIRIGMKGSHENSEKTYRIYIEEIPEPVRANKKAGTIGIYLRITPPVFIRPLTENTSGSIEDLFLERGTVSATVRNSGNVYFRLDTISFKGKSPTGELIYEKDVPGWYLLYGKSRTYQAAVPTAICNRLSTIEVVAKTAKFELNRVLNVHKEMCGQ
jgi:fimbrial chaperone protein